MGFREQHIQLVNTELRCELEPWSTTGRLSREALGFKKTKKIDSRASGRSAAASLNRISVSIHFSAGSFGPVRLHRQSQSQTVTSSSRRRGVAADSQSSHITRHLLLPTPTASHPLLSSSPFDSTSWQRKSRMPVLQPDAKSRVFIRCGALMVGRSLAGRACEWPQGEKGRARLLRDELNMIMAQHN
jgi:hypothetical protein